MNKKKILITGAAGFIGHHLLEHIIDKTSHDIVVVDCLNYASKGLSRLREDGFLSHPRVNVICSDLRIPFSEGVLREIGDDVNIIVHMAALLSKSGTVTSRPILTPQANPQLRASVSPMKILLASH